MNKLVIYGRLTKDLDLRYGNNGKYPYLFNSIAVDRYDRKEKKKISDFFNIIVGGKNAENMAKYSKKGARVLITGYLRNTSYSKNGESRTVTEIVAEDVNLIDVYKDNPDIDLVEVQEQDMAEVFADS